MNRRTTYQTAPLIRRRTRLVWDRREILAKLGVCIALVALILWAWAAIPDEAPDAAPASVSQVGTADSADSAPASVTAPTVDDIATLAPCPTEDSDNCHWMATEHGNGMGMSWVNVNGITYRLTGSADNGSDTGSADTGSADTGATAGRQAQP